jgi:protein required for attachment to host cells
MASNTHWVVLADEGRARFLEVRPGRELQDVEELTWPAAHADDADFRHDAKGRRSPGAVGPGGAAGASGGGGGRMPGSNTESAGESKLDHEAERFAHVVADKLAQAHRAQRYERLHIAAAPKFLGRLRRVLEREVSDSVVEEVDKDLLQLDPRALTERLFPQGTGTLH